MHADVFQCVHMQAFMNVVGVRLDIDTLHAQRI